MIANRCIPGQSLQKRDRPCDELKGGLINFEVFVVERRVLWKKSKIRNTNKIKFDRLIWSRRFSILFLVLLLFLFLFLLLLSLFPSTTG